MKGVVFTEFIELIESRFSADMIDAVIEEAALPNGGAYTAVGTYDHREMVKLVCGVARRSGVPVPELLETFGIHLFARFTVTYPQFFAGVADAFDFLENVESYIHVEVRKLYPDAELPSFASHRPDGTTLCMDYRSGRAMSDLALGLIRGCLAHFGVQADVSREDRSGGAGTDVRFTIRRQN